MSKNARSIHTSVRPPSLHPTTSITNLPPTDSCKTADLLSIANNTLNHLVTGQDTLLSADERYSALAQLALTVQAAAKLADVVHVEGLAVGGTGTVGGDTEALTERVRVKRGGGVKTEVEGEKVQIEARDPEQKKAETVKVNEEVQKLVAETERLHAEAEKVRRETERARAEAERARAEAEKVEKEAERAVAETERLKAEEMMLRSEKMKIDAETERVNTVTGRFCVETEKMRWEAETEADQAVKEAEMAGKGTAGAEEESARNDVEVETVGKEVESPVLAQEAKEWRSPPNQLSPQEEVNQEILEQYRWKIAPLRRVQLHEGILNQQNIAQMQWSNSSQ